MATPEFIKSAVQEAEKISPRGMGAGAASAGGDEVSNPVAVAGLADTVKNAIAGMHRAKATADALAANASRLVGNISTVDSLNSQLADANSQLEQAIAATEGPLEPSAQGVAGASVTGTPNTAPASHTSTEGQLNAAAEATKA